MAFLNASGPWQRLPSTDSPTVNGGGRITWPVGRKDNELATEQGLSERDAECKAFCFD